ncbi:MAG: FkbM family methyltransferase [Actinomycetota bacterium]
MKVLFDITTLGRIHCADGVRGAGIFRSVEEMAAALDRHPDVELSFAAAAPERRSALRYLADTGRFAPSRFALPSLGRAVHGGPIVGGLASACSIAPGISSQFADHLDSVYSPARVHDPGDYDVYHLNWKGVTRLPYPARPAVLVSVLDVIAIKHPEWFVRSGQPNPIGAYLTGLLESVHSAHAITVNASSVREDILELFPRLSHEQIHVVPLGASDSFGPRPLDEIDAVRRRLGIPDGHRYVLCVNTLEPRKNMVAAVEAFGRLVTDGGADVTLVLAGSDGWLADDLLERIRSTSGVDRASIVVTGYVDDSDLPALYAGAALFCYPSLDEGFGLPVIEAMRSGVPVVTSDRRALAEAAGDAALTVDPQDHDALAAAMASVLDNADLAADLAARSLERGRSYTWDRTAAAVVSAYEWALEANTVTRRSVRRGANPASVWRDVTEAGTSLPDLRDLFAGKRAVIVGDDGDVPTSLLGEEFTFAVNGYHLHRRADGWRPTFHVVAADGLAPAIAASVNGLVGSIVFAEERIAPQLRSGADVIAFGMEEVLGSVKGIDAMHLHDDVEALGTDRALIASILLARHLGFDPIYLIAPRTDPGFSMHRPATSDQSTPALPTGRLALDATPKEIRRRWHMGCRDIINASGAKIANLSDSSLPGIYERGDMIEVLAPGTGSDIERSGHAHLDENEVIADLLDTDDGPRVVLDVGAHRGTSARHFAERGWRVLCFEPDPDNRSRLERRLGQMANVSIDPRAVGHQRADRVPFFASIESSGISGLSAFRESHEITAHVEMTTIADVTDQHALDHVDFLKIDVEGHDLDVLRGVPWDRLRPAIVSCEFEDAKTMPMGHTTRDIAEFLLERGYTVYASEWHPIVRYGVAHDWRRLVPYPGVTLPSNSWGNLIAFLDDPGFPALRAAFQRRLESRPEAPTAPPQALPTPAPLPTPARAEVERTDPPAPADRRFYADRADRLRRSSPIAYSSMRLVWRSSRAVLRRPVLALAAIILGLAVLAAGLVAPSTGWRVVIWGGSIVIMLGLAILGTAAYAYKTAIRVSEESKRIRSLERR